MKALPDGASAGAMDDNNVQTAQLYGAVLLSGLSDVVEVDRRDQAD